jgi:hypothetical protein
MAITKASSNAVAPAAKGDLVVGNATNDSGILSVGTANQVLTVDSTTATGLKWASASAAPTSATNKITTSETTTSTSFTNLATSGPEVTLTTGTKVLVIISGLINNNSGEGSFMGFAVSGASNISATTAKCLSLKVSANGNVPLQASLVTLQTVTAGSNTFTAKYASGANTCTFSNREITVIDLGS